MYRDLGGLFHLEMNRHVSWQRLLGQVDVSPDTEPELPEVDDAVMPQPPAAGDDDLATFRL